jgi:hypothetical protein
MNKNLKTPENIRINNKKYYEKKKQEKEEAKLKGEIVIQEKVYKTPAYIRKAIKAYQNNNPDKIKQWSDLNNSKKQKKKKEQNETINTTIDSLILNEN